MRSETSLLWWWLGILNSRRYAHLVQRYGGLDEALKALSPALLKEMGMKDETVQKTYERINAFDPAKTLADMHEHHVRLLSIEDEQYPAVLKEIADPPVFLSYIGDIDILRQPLLGVVGTRRMSPYGRRVVETFVPELTRHGIVTVSGLAIGVDAAVAKDTIEAGGKTVAVLGSGLAAIYPTVNERLAQRIAEKGGLVLSEFPLHQQPEQYTFPSRNRIIAGLSRGTLVIEAPVDSGSIITAELALEYNRDVYAVPGQIFDDHVAGSHQLIASGQGKLVTCAHDILEDMGIAPSSSDDTTRPSFLPRTPDEALVYRALTPLPQTTDDLAVLTKLDAARIGVALTMMELAGAARTLGGGQWVRI